MEIVIVGSGPSAAAVAMAYDGVREARITVVDLGGALEPERVNARSALATATPGQWQPQDLQLVSALPAPSRAGTIPTKQIYGSNFPFQNFGQLDGIDAEGDANSLVVSGAYGGFSNTWGAQMMPYSTGTFRTWPIGRDDLEPHYRAILREVPYSGESDDLEEVFPLMGHPDHLPKVSDRTASVLRNYGKRRLSARKHGVTAGHARLAMRGSACVRCGLCMTGCPYEYVYSASQTFDDLRSRGRIDYRPGLKVHRVEEDSDGRATVHASSADTGELHTIGADKVFLAAGAIGTTRIAANSLGLTGRKVVLAESVQFMMPFVSAFPTKSLAQDGEFTLNQFNLFVTFDSDGKDAALVHCYPFNDIMRASLPAFLSSGPQKRVTDAGLRRLTVGLGYLPSWASPSPELRIGEPAGPYGLPSVHVTSQDNPMTTVMLGDVVKRLRRVGPALDLYPIPGQTKISAPAKSYHFGGAFPMMRRPTNDFSSDLYGRVGSLQNVHLVDASIFPTVPATTFTLTIMANAHRIASQALQGHT